MSVNPRLKVRDRRKGQARIADPARCPNRDVTVTGPVCRRAAKYRPTGRAVLTFPATARAGSTGRFGVAPRSRTMHIAQAVKSSPTNVQEESDDVGTEVEGAGGGFEVQHRAVETILDEEPADVPDTG